VSGRLEQLRGRLAVVTGAGSGIGRATALAFAKEGANVVCSDIDSERAAATAADAQRYGVAAHAERVDVADAAAIEAFANAVSQAHGVPDIVVNNAGIAIAGSFLDTSIADWQQLMGVNMWGVIHGCHFFGRQMVERGSGGQIVNVASAAAFLPSKVLPAYCTSKAAVLMLSQCLQADFAGHGIGVTAICPGFVATPITRAARYVGMTDAEQEQQRERATRIYARRNYTPERVAAQILRAVRRNTAVAPVTPEAHLMYALSRATPGLLRRLARVQPMR
jgi:NAD(P)-dependent dehydrogenase (short-subunit alcohol dehydrogenase family)